VSSIVGFSGSRLTLRPEFTAAYNLLIHLVNQSPTRDMLLARICEYLEQPITSSSQFGSSLALSTLTTIFNTLPETSESRYHVFLAILQVIGSTSSASVFDSLIPQLKSNIPKWLAAWQLDDEDARSLHVAIADVAAEAGKDNLSYEYLLHALETIPPQSASEPEARSLAKRALVAALNNPSVTDFTALTASEAIQSLKTSDASLYELLEIFSSDDYASYTEFISATPLASLDLPDTASDILVTKMRLLTFATTAANSQNRSVPYAEIASALQIPAEDVEKWAIDTIRAGLVEGKLSQLKQEFLVQRATYRVFGEKHWAEIQGRLMVWRRSLEGVLSVVRTERERFEREGMGGGMDGEQGYQQERGGRPNGYGGGDRRQGGQGRRQQQQHQQQQQPQREVDSVGAGD
jgi:translation initiation factor 3 subunit M